MSNNYLGHQETQDSPGQCGSIGHEHNGGGKFVDKLVNASAPDKISNAFFTIVYLQFIPRMQMLDIAG